MEPTLKVRLPRHLWDLVVAQAARERRSAASELAVIVERGTATQSPPIQASAKKTKKEQEVTPEIHPALAAYRASLREAEYSTRSVPPQPGQEES